MVRSSPSRTTVQLDGLAGLVGADRDDQGDAVGDPLAVDPGDQVVGLAAPPSAAGVPSGTWSMRGALAVGHPGLHRGADDRVARLPVAEDLVGGHPDLLDRDREPDADVAGLPRWPRRSWRSRS